MSRFPTANKRFGQHFLHSPNVINAITGDIPDGVDAIIEVGPGPAVLTPKLVHHGLPVHVVEMDKRFLETLAEVVGPQNVHQGDALDVEWDAFLDDKGIKRAWMVSNLPYNVSVPLTLAFMRCPRFIRMTLMYQKEVAEKFHPRETRNSMGSLAALAATWFKVGKLVDVPPGAFSPPPKVMSQVLRFDRLPEPALPLADWEKLEEFMRPLFQNRRKQMQGQLRGRLDPARLEAFFREEELPAGIRAEALTLPQVWKLYQLSRMD